MDKTEQKKRTIKEEKFQIGPDVKMDDRLGMNICTCLSLCIFMRIHVCVICVCVYMYV
jgi:hypothetical protein